jgi:hypothetical protein
VENSAATNSALKKIRLARIITARRTDDIVKKFLYLSIPMPEKYFRPALNLPAGSKAAFIEEPIPNRKP